MEILIVEDEKQIVELIRTSLEAEGYRCLSASNGLDALKVFRSRQPDILLLDIGLPGQLTGLEVCTRIRQEPGVNPFIIMLTARICEIDRIIGYSSGADDYISKPFSPKELAVRLRAVVGRRDRGKRVQGRKNEILSPHFIIDLDARQVMMQKGVKLELVTDLSTVEFDVLVLLASEKGRVRTREELLDLLKGLDFVGDMRAIDGIIYRLRKKISPDGDREKFIKTHFGIGYSFKDEREEVAINEASDITSTKTFTR